MPFEQEKVYAVHRLQFPASVPVSAAAESHQLLLPLQYGPADDTHHFSKQLARQRHPGLFHYVPGRCQRAHR